MPKLSLFNWFANAAAVLSGRHGAPTERAKEAGCSRQTVYNHSHRLQAVCTNGIPDPDCLQRLETENAELRLEIDRLRAEARTAVQVGEEQLRRFVVTAEATGAVIVGPAPRRQLLAT